MVLDLGDMVEEIEDFKGDPEEEGTDDMDKEGLDDTEKERLDNIDTDCSKWGETCTKCDGENGCQNCGE